MATPPDFTVGQVLTSAAMNQIGLWRIDEVSLSAVTNNISNVFSSDFNAYRVVITDLNNASATTRVMSIRLRSPAGNDQTANYFSTDQFWYATNQSGSITATGATSGTIASISSNGNGGGSVIIDINAPNLAKMTTYQGSSNVFQSSVNQFVNRTIMGGVNTVTQYTGFSIIGTTDNLSGTVRIYGYRK